MMIKKLDVTVTESQIVTVIPIVLRAIIFTYGIYN